jgi:transcriptional regulator with XRE-family HTH domain
LPAGGQRKTGYVSVEPVGSQWKTEMEKHFRIEWVAVVGPTRLALAYADGYTADVDLAPVIDRIPALARLRDPAVFAQVAVQASGYELLFAGDDGLSLASDNLRARSIEQAGDCSHEQIVAWMHRHDLALYRAARTLGVSRRALTRYRSGKKLIPRIVGLAMIGWDVSARTRMPPTKKHYCRDGSVPHEVVEIFLHKGWSMIRAWRKYVGFKRTHMAQALGVTRGEYTAMEASGNKPCKLDRRRIAAILGISVKQLG